MPISLLILACTIQCHECGKWQLLHSKNKVKGCDQQVLDQVLEIIYSCGGNICDVADEGQLQCLNTVYLRLDPICQSKIELPYYSAGFEAICIYCGTTDNPQAHIPKYYPLCKICSHEGKPKIKRRTRSYPKELANQITSVLLILVCCDLKTAFCHWLPSDLVEIY